ncbi:MAG: phosphomannomutase [Polyangiaceae bacterium]
MTESGVGFGTSGARGLVSAMTDQVCAAYTMAFVQALQERGEITSTTPIGIAGDRRPSTGRILSAAAYAIRKLGHPVVHAGRVPSPAIALLGLEQRIPTLMVTGSHIPDDRNGIKFNKTTGEILKRDEAEIAAQSVDLPDDFDANGMLREGVSDAVLPPSDPTAQTAYVARWLRAFPPGIFAGKRIVVYGHSAVGRDLLVEVLQGLGAEVVRVGWSDRFIPVDTEAIRDEDATLAREWAAQYRPFAIVSTDGDADRPLVSDENGLWLRGDVLGVLTARFLGAHTVVTPVSSNTVVERASAFAAVARTRIGSPFVIERMLTAVAEGSHAVAGYEANGGFLTATAMRVPGGDHLSPLPTRDPIVVMLSVLTAAIQSGRSVSALAAELPSRVTASGRLQNFPNALSGPRLAALAESGLVGFDALLSKVAGHFVNLDMTDGLRGTTAEDEIVHLRASGNAPELRCYAESTNQTRAESLVAQTLAAIQAAWTR